MFALLLFQAAGIAGQTAIPADFDLADITAPAPIVVTAPVHRRSRYRPPLMETPRQVHKPVSVRLRGRKVRLRMAFGGP